MLVSVGLKSGHEVQANIHRRDIPMGQTLEEVRDDFVKLAQYVAARELEGQKLNYFTLPTHDGTYVIHPASIEYVMVGSLAEHEKNLGPISYRPQDKVTLQGTSVPNED